MKIGIIGDGAIGRYVGRNLFDRGLGPKVILTRFGDAMPPSEGTANYIQSINELPEGITLMVDCAGHAALAEHGCAILRRGIDLITVSVGALADADLARRLEKSAAQSGAQLHLVSGAIGALDCLRAAKVGGLQEVTYVGRKPPLGWRGSPAEAKINLGALNTATTHFEGTARDAAITYPKNANVAAAVAMAGVGFDATHVKLVADPEISDNIHEIRAAGTFGQFSFRVEGHSLPDNPRSSALAAMSVISAIERELAPITI